MKCLITGHTSGIGKMLYERFSKLGFDTAGVSKSSGYDFENRYDDIIKLALGCDIFLNNAYHKDFQIRFIKDLEGKIPYIITLGSAAAYLYEATKKIEYCEIKNNLLTLNKKLSFKSKTHLLLLNVAMTENSTPDPGCLYSNITDICELWLKDPCFHMVDFNLPMTDTNLRLIENEFGITSGRNF